MRYSAIILILLSCMSCSHKDDTPLVIELNNNWQFKKVSDTVWHKATVPGNVFTDLLENELIPNPFIGDNEAKVQWISETDWEYKTYFSIDKKTLNRKHLELNFDGLDTYASVFLNDSLVLKTGNAFRQFSADVKPILKRENTLRILFEKPSKYEEIAKAKLPYTLPEGNRIFSRKAQFQYGWDWGPKLNTMGIWRPIKLIAWNDAKIYDAYINQLEVSDSIAKLSLQVDFANSRTSGYTYELFVNDTLFKVIEEKPQYNPAHIPFEIKSPRLWWPHNLGEPYLYDIKVVIKNGKKILDSVSIKHGLRTINLVTDKDSLGESFYFKVNNVPVYAKGANYIPQHSFQNKVTDEHYKKLLSDVVNANMNMLRVWGGGIYENDVFYELCDEKGILVWQDFMFACAMYPGDLAFLENVKQEAIDNVKRLRNHASLALWCGNNESSEGWYRWGWQDGRSEAEKEEIWNNYLKVFDSILPSTVRTYTNVDYWQSSPKYGRGNPHYQFEGDAHDWWVWHDGYPFQQFEEHVPRFMSEFGFQSFPSVEVIKNINQKDSLNLSSKDFQNHQKHPRGFQLIQNYMERDFPVPSKPEDYVYMSQLVQAYGVTKGIEAQRRAKPKSMGSLYWQLNDCWPAVSWSSLDFLGNWKALHYKAKHSFDDLLISTTLENGILKTFVVNDDFQEHEGVLNTLIMNFYGNVLYQIGNKIHVDAFSSEVKNQLHIENLGLDKEQVVVLNVLGKDSILTYLSKPKDLKLKQEAIQLKRVSKINIGFEIELYSTTLQKDVFISTDVIGHFSDNFFDLLPNRTKVIQFETNVQEVPELKTKSLNNFIRD